MGAHLCGDGGGLSSRGAARNQGSHTAPGVVLPELLRPAAPEGEKRTPSEGARGLRATLCQLHAAGLEKLRAEASRKKREADAVASGYTSQSQMDALAKGQQLLVGQQLEGGSSDTMTLIVQHEAAEARVAVPCQGTVAEALLLACAAFDAQCAQ